MFIISNAYIRQYRGGMGCGAFSPHNHNKDEAYRGIGGPSIFVVHEPATTNISSYDPTMSITGRPELFGREIKELTTKNMVDYTNAAYAIRASSFASVPFLRSHLFLAFSRFVPVA